jgi:hypothetical protein
VGRIAELLDQAQPPEREARQPDVPKGWEPGVRWSNETGTGELITPPLAAAPDSQLWIRILNDFGLSGDEFEIIDGSLSLIGWKSPVKGASPDDPPERQTINLTRYKVRLRRKTHARDTVDIDALCKAARQRKPSKRDVQVTDRALVVCLSDWQVGKGEGGGSAATVDRITEAFDQLERRLSELAKVGRPVGLVYLVGLGDIVEQCDNSHYPSQAFTTDLNRREQMRVARRLILNVVDRMVDRGLTVVLSAVAGNHGENRQNGKAISTPDDSDDLAVFEQVAEILASNPERYSNVSTFLPTALSMTLDIAGVPVGFTHGHIARGGTGPVGKIEKWWTGQVMGFGPVADARILVTGHYHHLLVVESTGRTHLQCPAMDGGSGWWTERTGQHSPAGMLTFLAGTDCGPRGWEGLQVL